MCIALIGASLAVFGINFKGAAAAGLCVLLVALAMIDLEHQLLPDVLTLPLLWAGLLVNVQGTFAPLASAVLGAAAGYGVLWVLYWAFRLLARKEGMGFGDFKLLAALGAWLGTGHLLEMILVSSVVAAVTTLALIALKKMDRENPFPFGPFLAIAGVVSLLVGPLALPVV
ncbi:prepilin peptidase [Pandoraea pnomenusa]|nr:prepilin peptidase [Pandoraea pnomenusa]QDH62199.1 prepilin peptidase [Pandoraea pnomenusa]QDX24298.1 prepilin peptidase [Pandoraea pnomenusa]